MIGKSKAIGEELYNRSKVALKRNGVRGEIGRRLQAIISAKENNISKVAKIYRITRTTLMKWIARFEEKGIRGFSYQSSLISGQIINRANRLNRVFCNISNKCT